LQEIFRQAPARSMLLLQAPAGFGKSRVLMEWMGDARRRRVTPILLKLSGTPRAAHVLLDGVIEALGAAPRKQPPARSPGEIAQRIVELIGRRAQRVALLIDDFHLAAAEDTEKIVAALLDAMPENLVMAMATRTTPRLSLSRLMLEGRLQRLDASRLRFSLAEARAFFGGSLAPGQVRAAHELTEGWPAALRIVELCAPAWRAAGGELTSLAAFGELVDEYIDTELLRGMESASVELLRSVSIVDVVTPTLACELFQSEDCSRRLDDLIGASGLFSATAGRTDAYALPGLVRASFRRRLQRRDVRSLRELNARAAAWYERAGNVREAASHYVAADEHELAAAAVERSGPIGIAIHEGDDRAAAVLRILPEKQVIELPRLALCRIFLDYKQGFLAEARHRYEELSRRTASFTRDRPGGDDGRLAMEAAFMDLVMQVYQRSHVSHAFLRSIEARLAPDHQADLQLRMTIQLVLGMLYKLRGDLELAGAAFAEAEKLSGRMLSRWMTIWMRHHSGSLALARGQLHEAKHQLQTGLKMWRAHFHQEQSYRAISYVLLAEADYEMNATSEAQAKIDEAMYSAEHVEGWYEVYASLYETAVRLALHADEPERADALLVRAEGINRIRDLLAHVLPAMRVLIAVHAGQLSRARDLAAKARLARLWHGASSVDELSCRDWDLIAASLCRLAIESGDLDDAERIIERAYQGARLSGRLRSQARTLLLRADIERARGHQAKAMQHFDQALEFGKTHGYSRTFLDEPVILRRLLDLAASRAEGGLRTHLASFADKLRNALPGNRPPQPQSQGPFSAREREVMHELVHGHSNKLIARKLALSEPTVKFHVQNIFRKLQVRRRASAVAEAHRRGLLT
jgi:LuxR family maltose regulon positive regulatory protein